MAHGRMAVFIGLRKDRATGNSIAANFRLAKLTTARMRSPNRGLLEGRAVSASGDGWTPPNGIVVPKWKTGVEGGTGQRAP